MYCSGNASHFFMSQPSYIPKEYLQIEKNNQIILLLIYRNDKT